MVEGCEDFAEVIQVTELRHGHHIILMTVITFFLPSPPQVPHLLVVGAVVAAAIIIRGALVDAHNITRGKVVGLGQVVEAISDAAEVALFSKGGEVERWAKMMR